MRRLRAFVLTELLTAMLMQGLFIVVLCTSFYLLTSFYSNTQQVLTARAHAERVIAFFDDKIRHAGLGLWKCENPIQVREVFAPFTEFTPYTDERDNTLLRKICLPVAITSTNFDKNTNNNNRKPKFYTDTRSNHKIHYGSCVTLFYAQRDLSHTHKSTSANSTGDIESILVIRNGSLQDDSSELTLLDTGNTNLKNYKNTEFYKESYTGVHDIRNWVVIEGAGVPFCMYNHDNSTTQSIQGYGIAIDSTIPAAGELMYLKCMQIFVQGKDNVDEGRQLAFREPTRTPYSHEPIWNSTYNQEKGILEIYMELDTETNIFTLYVLASGGTDYTINTERPAEWPERAEPTASNWGKKINDDKNYTAYPHHIIYVSRASWKLNNIPEGFNWSRIE